MPCLLLEGTEEREVPDLDRFWKNHLEPPAAIHRQLAPQLLDSRQKHARFAARFHLNEFAIRSTLGFEVAMRDKQSFFEDHDLIATFLDIPQEV